jgi:hypothetical protein
VLLGFGATAIIVALFSKPRPSNFPNTLLYVGGVLIGLSVFESRIRRGKFGPVEIEVDQPESEAGEAREVAQEFDSGGPFSVNEGSVETVSRYFAGQRALEALLAVRLEACGEARYMVFLPDEDTGRLLPIFTKDEEFDPGGWEIGKGATGAAYLRGEYVVALGEATHDETYGLTRAQGARYQGVTGVSAMPLSNASGRSIGVLTATTSEVSPVMATDGARDAMLTLGLQITRVLVDLLKWYSDD